MLEHVVVPNATDHRGFPVLQYVGQAGTTWGRQVITEQVASSCRAHRRWNAGGDAPKRYVDLPEHVSKTLCSVGAAYVRRRRRRGRA